MQVTIQLVRCMFRGDRPKLSSRRNDATFSKCAIRFFVTTVQHRRPNQSEEIDARLFATMDRIHTTFDVAATRAVVFKPYFAFLRFKKLATRVAKRADANARRLSFDGYASSTPSSVIGFKFKPRNFSRRPVTSWRASHADSRPAVVCIV